jgi:hypothetical protein
MILRFAGNVIYDAQLPISIELPDGTLFWLKMISESEAGLFTTNEGDPDQPECLWSKDYGIHNQEVESA